jgi:carboxylesterase type B
LVLSHDLFGDCNSWLTPELLSHSFRDHNSFRFLGIRYAPQPERFTYSTLYTGPGGTVSALDYGSECVQGTSGSEDCLFLNVWTPYLPASPSSSSSKLKPVLFWIHGGAFTSGTGSDPTFDGGNFASRGDVVLVTINYRLSTLGFLALNDGVTKGNFGFADQIVALDWVREHIRSFGGDPDRITIFGQSAGAGSVRGMMASPVALGKFAGAVPMSNLGGLAYGTTYSKYYTIPEEVSAAADAILNATGCSHTPSQVNCLREVDPFTLVNLPTVARFFVVDGTYLTSDQLPLSGNHGKTAPYKLMMGLEADDGTPFITFPPDVTPENTEWLTSQGLPYPPRSLFPLEPLENTTLAVDRMGARLATDAIFRCIDQATVHAGLINRVWDRVFFYEMERSYQTPGWPMLDLCQPPVEPGYPYGDPEAKIGYDKCHSGELLYVFGNIRWNGLPYRDSQGDADFEKELLDRWAAFATTADPNLTGAKGGEGARWIAATSGDNILMHLDWPGETMHAFEELSQCAWLGLPIDYYLKE